MLGGVPDGEREHRLWIRGIDDVDEIVVALRVVDRLDLDAQSVELCPGFADPLRLLACPLRAQISEQHIFHSHLHVMLIILREGPWNYTTFGDLCLRRSAQRSNGQITIERGSVAARARTPESSGRSPRCRNVTWAKGDKRRRLWPTGR